MLTGLRGLWQCVVMTKPRRKTSRVNLNQQRAEFADYLTSNQITFPGSIREQAAAINRAWREWRMSKRASIAILVLMLSLLDVAAGGVM